MKLLEENVLPWVTEAFGDNYVFTQDGAPSHTSNVTQQWCKSHFSGFWDKNAWPPSSPDANPMDFAIWSILESDVSRVSYQNVTALKKALVASWERLSEEVEEKEVLLSIYEGDENFKLIAENVYQYKVECGENKFFLLKLTWPENYPNVAPDVDLDTFFNKQIPKTIKESITKKILAEAQQYLGMSMSYSLFEWAKENGTELMKDHDGNSATNAEDEISSDLATTYIQDDCNKKKKEKKEQLTKAQKRKMTNRLDNTGQNPRGWDWIDVIKHLSQVGSREQQSQPAAQSGF
ncbi:RWD domain-containing protein 4 [Nymphon striatum]|nr:RWD domain-containing protein 4 [Nymphon striatum]